MIARWEHECELLRYLEHEAFFIIVLAVVIAGLIITTTWLLLCEHKW